MLPTSPQQDQDLLRIRMEISVVNHLNVSTKNSQVILFENRTSIFSPY